MYCILNALDSSRDAGLIDLFELVEVDVSDETLDEFGDEEYILYRLQLELGGQFNTHKQIVLKHSIPTSHIIVPLQNLKELVCMGQIALT